MEIPKSNFKMPRYNFEADLTKDEDQSIYSITQTVVTQIVKEQNEYTIAQIEKYVKEKQQAGEIISSNIIGEGKLRHIINLGLTIYARQNNIPISQDDLFTQEDYIEYLNHRLDQAEKMIRELQTELRNQKGDEDFE